MSNSTRSSLGYSDAGLPNPLEMVHACGGFQLGVRLTHALQGVNVKLHTLLPLQQLWTELQVATEA